MTSHLQVAWELHDWKIYILFALHSLGNNIYLRSKMEYQTNWSERIAYDRWLYTRKKNVKYFRRWDVIKKCL